MYTHIWSAGSTAVIHDVVTPFFLMYLLKSNFQDKCILSLFIYNSLEMKISSWKLLRLFSNDVEGSRGTFSGQSENCSQRKIFVG